MSFKLRTREVAASILERFWPQTTPDSQAEGDLPVDYDAILEAGLDYQALVECRGWKRLLDDLEARADRELGALRKISRDPNFSPLMIKDQVTNWRESEDSLQFVQDRANEAITHRKNMIQDLAIRAGIDSGQSRNLRELRRVMGPNAIELDSADE